MKAKVTVEIEIKDDIEKLYSNFNINYQSKEEYKTSDAYFDADDSANVIWEQMI